MIRAGSELLCYPRPYNFFPARGEALATHLTAHRPNLRCRNTADAQAAAALFSVNLLDHGHQALGTAACCWREQVRG